jgi:hypothetical protein
MEASWIGRVELFHPYFHPTASHWVKGSKSQPWEYQNNIK